MFRNSLKILVLSVAFCSEQHNLMAQQLTRYVDPFIGTGGHGHTYPGATVPFGMVQLSPDNGVQGWDWCSGYNYSSNTIAGFSHTHLSGTGCGDWVDISVLPHTHHINDTFHFFTVPFSHKNEHASPGYYDVTMDNGVKVSLTTTERCGLHRYEFPKNDSAIVRLHLSYTINYDKATRTRLYLENDTTIVGYRYSKGWADVQRVYFAIRLSRPVNKLNIYNNDTHAEVDMEDEKGDVYNGEIEFGKLNGQAVMMKVALSSVSTEKALEALKEIKGWNFEQTRKNAEAKWEKELQKIQVTTKDERLKKIFYTALYHTCMAPVLYSDADGQYQNAKGTVCGISKKQRYTVFSLWDTFRGLNPLFTITQPERNIDILNSMLVFFDETGLLPVWELSSAETNCMSGYHAVPVLADAILKNTPGLDAEHAFEAMVKTAHQQDRGTQDYIKYGYLPADKGSYSVTLTVEYAYDDWCIAQVAKKLGKTAEYKEYMERAQSWKKLFDVQSGFIRGKNADGKWRLPFNPYLTSTDWKTSMYEEGNAWQYTFFVPHDVRGLAATFGSNELFIKKLDSLFTVNSMVLGESAPPDVSGLIGQYAHGNEPSHHIIYMYSYLGQPWKTQQLARRIIDTMYHTEPEGYSGNEDCGQMSAWAVWSMAGMFPANPANGEYVFGSPVFDAANFKLPGGKQMQIKAVNNSPDNKYIQSVKLNGKPYALTYITHADLLKGGTLEFTMGAKPSEQWGVSEATWPGKTL